MTTRTALSVARRTSQLATIVKRSPRRSAAVLAETRFPRPALKSVDLPAAKLKSKVAATPLPALRRPPKAAAVPTPTGARPTKNGAGTPPAAAAPTLRLAAARTGDHPAIHKLLVSVFHGPSATEFQAQLDEPGYEPADRLVVRDGDQVAAHLRLARQTIQAGQVRLPVVRFMDLATATEYRSRGLATAMLAAGERHARQRGALVGLTRTRAPELFARQGWTICGRHLFSSAPPRQVLAELGATSSGLIPDPPLPALSPLRPRQERIAVRPLRRVELPAIMKLYAEDIAGRFGSPIRSEEYWDWLLARGACDRIYVAATLPEPADLSKLLDSIVGYAFVRESRLVELVCGGRSDVARHLVARLCADASEQNDWLVRCDVPAQDELHALFHRAGGSQTREQSLGGEVFMARLFDPLAALRAVTPTLALNAKAAGSKRPWQLGLELRSGTTRGPSGVVDRFCLQFDGRHVQVETGIPSQHSLVLRYADLAPLLLADCSAEEMLAAGRLKAATRPAREAALAIFPRAAWWRPPLDDLLA